MKWEYKIEYIGTMVAANLMEKELNAAGADGWELVSIVENFAIFKRPAHVEVELFGQANRRF